MIGNDLDDQIWRYFPLGIWGNNIFKASSARLKVMSIYLSGRVQRSFVSAPSSLTDIDLMLVAIYLITSLSIL